jgi:predicted dehydrogenase
MPRSKVNRRNFLKTTAAGAAALSLTAASASRVLGANDRIGVAFIGVGGRCQEHIGIITKMQKENKGAAAVAVCDVWDGHEYEKEVERDGKKRKQVYHQGLYPSAKRCNLNVEDKEHVTKDYRRILDLKDVDVVCVATPDHWHAKISIDAAEAGKDVYCEKPMTKTIDEAHAVVDTMRKHNRVMTVGVQSMADPTWRKAYDLIRNGKIGHVCQAQTSYYRNSKVGQWRYYELFKEMNPTTVDWDMFLGHQFSAVHGIPLAPKVPFDRAIFGQWRCYWPFGGGMFTDLFVHQTTHMIAAMGVRYPSRVVGGGGVYLEYDERDVPDVATVVADYDEGCQLIITATMINDYPIEEVIRGRLGTIRFKDHVKGTKDGKEEKEFGLEILPQNVRNAPGGPKKMENMEGEFIPGGLAGHDTTMLWQNFLDCVRSRNRETMSTPELGAAAFTTVNMGVQSYRKGQALFWDKEARRPFPADSSWARRWEERSKDRGKPNQIIGWHGGDSGSTLEPPEYQKLGGPWVDGKDPAEGLVSRQE